MNPVTFLFGIIVGGATVASIVSPEVRELAAKAAKKAAQELEKQVPAEDDEKDAGDKEHSDDV